MPVQKIKSGRIITVQAPTYVGEKGTIFYDEDTPELRLSDGYTPGGILFATGSGGTSTYVLVTATNARLGGVKIGSNITVSPDGTISVAPISLNDLTDVDTATVPPTDSQALVYNATSGLWVPGSVGSGSIVPATTSTLGGIKTGPDFYMDSTSTLYINQNLWYTAERVNQAITEALSYDYGFIAEPIVVLTNDLGNITDPVV